MPIPPDRVDAARRVLARPLAQRALSALIMIPAVMFTVYIGGPVFAAITAFASAVMLFEWSRMVERRSFSAAFYALSLASVAAMFCAANGRYSAAIALAAIGGLAGAYFAKRSSGIGGWSAVGAIYIIMPCIALLWLRLDAPSGRALTFLLFAVVWAADTGAFAFGKFIGGPKISYSLSPSKTWAGIGGGIFGGCLVGALAGGVLFGLQGAFLLLFIGGGLGAASVIGDLVESAFKRNFGLKDISGFIPGHGGALDRLDGMIFATTAMTGGLLLYMLAEKVQG